MKALRKRLLPLAVVTFATSFSAFAQPASDTASAAKAVESPVAAAKRQYADGKLDLNAPFDIEAQATIGSDGRIDANSIKYTRTDGDPALIELVKGYISTVNDSPYIQHIAMLGATSVVIRAKQDDSQFAGAGVLEMPNALRAMTVKSMLSTMLPLLRKQKDREDMSEADKSELALLNATSVSSSGRYVTVSLNMPKAAFRDIVEAELKKK